jgi:hypothetical protein
MSWKTHIAKILPNMSSACYTEQFTTLAVWLHSRWYAFLTSIH